MRPPNKCQYWTYLMVLQCRDETGAKRRLERDGAQTNRHFKTSLDMEMKHPNKPLSRLVQTSCNPLHKCNGNVKTLIFPHVMRLSLWQVAADLQHSLNEPLLLSSYLPLCKLPSTVSLHQDGPNN